MSVNKEHILKLMAETNIPGVSIAIINDTSISSIELGTVSCSFDKMKETPSKEIQSTFDTSRYILTEHEFLYYDEYTKELQEVTKDPSIINELKKYFSEDKQIFSLSKTQIEEITRITGHQPANHPIKPETVFGAASLSKPVFAYLVLKLIEENKSNNALELGAFTLPEDVAHFDLDTPLYKILPGLSAGGVNAEKLTARMVLSHTTGIPMSADNQCPGFLFKPGTEYGYNGVPYFYLQMALEKLTGASLEELAQEHVFGPKALDMKHSTFLRPGYTSSPAQQDENPSAQLFPIDMSKFASISANSLRTTASDYARFMSAWMNDERLSCAFNNEILMTEDQWAKDMALPQTLLKKVAWGIGLGLQLDNEGQITGAFHSGDMNGWRAIVAMNPNDGTGVVYFANSPDGDVLAQEITSGVINLTDGLEYISEKYGFAIRYEDNWKEKQQARFDKVSYYFESLAGMHASEADWVAEELDFQTHQDEYMRPVVEEQVIHAEGMDKFKHYKQSIRELKGSEDVSSIQDLEVRSTITPFKTSLDNSIST